MNGHTRNYDEGDDGFSTLHPDRGGGEIPCESVTHGLNADFSAYPETAYIRCKKCGFILNTRRHSKGWGTGIGFSSEEGYGNGPWGGGYAIIDPVVLSGCPLCGTYLYD